MHNIPLPELIRPEKLEDFFGQEELTGKNSFLFQAIQKDQVPSMILWGPPGSGKTTLAQIIAKTTSANFLQISATTSGKKDLLKIIDQAQKNLQKNKKTILFLDEIHRWNKSQQDALLPFIEKGTLILIGATTENPSFEVNSALISRIQIFTLKRLSHNALKKIINRALKIIDPEKKIKITAEAAELLINLSNGDARVALNTLDACRRQKKLITPAVIQDALQKNHLLYDKSGEEHYNLISALHKSMRGGDTNASIYWLARMLEGGEDPLYIARRLIRFASEDIGLANNTALLLANAVFDTCHKLGYPECNVHLTQCVIYLAKSKKNISAYLAYEKAKKDVEKFGNLPVPLHLRNAPTNLMQKMGYGRNYKYTPLENSSKQEYLPPEIKNVQYL